MNEIAYARTLDGAHVAFRVLAAAADCEPCNDLVMVSGGLIPMAVFEDDPGLERLLEGLRGLGPVVMFDRRGIGLSDPIVDWERPVLDQWADDLAAVVEASGAHDLCVFAWDGYGIATRFAAAHPDKLRSLILYSPVFPVPGGRWDDWVAQRLGIMHGNLAGRQDDFLQQIAPSRVSDGSFRDWYARAGREGASPATAARIWESVFSSRPSDLRIEAVETPTLVLCRRDNVWAPADGARHAASLISNASLVELDGGDHFPFLGDVDAVVAEVANFVIGERRLPPPQRLLAAVMFTDLVASTEYAASIGDARWKSVLDRHDAVSRTVVETCGGTIVKSTGDGVLALLPSTSAALRASERIRDALAPDGLDVRIGIHIGDIDRRGEDVSGLAVVVAVRAMAVAGAGQIIVTASVAAAVTDQTATLEKLGPHKLKGLPGTWDLFRVANITRGRT